MTLNGFFTLCLNVCYYLEIDINKPNLRFIVNSFDACISHKSSLSNACGMIANNNKTSLI